MKLSPSALRRHWEKGCGERPPAGGRLARRPGCAAWFPHGASLIRGIAGSPAGKSPSIVKRACEGYMTAIETVDIDRRLRDLESKMTIRK